MTRPRPLPPTPAQARATRRHGRVARAGAGWLATLAFLALSGPAGGEPPPADPAAVLREVVGSRVGKAEPGCAAGYLSGGRLAAEAGFGLADVAAKRPMTPATPVYVASASKQFTALAVLLLEADGRLSLADDVRRHVPELPDYGTPITLAMLMHHTSGLRDYLNLVYLTRGLDLGGIGQRQAVALVARQKGLNHPPGARFSYTNSGYLLLAEVVSRVSGKPFQDFLRERVLDPLGMGSSHFAGAVPASAAQAMGYRREGEAFRADADVSAVDGPSGLVTTIRDLALYEADFRSPARVWTPALKRRALEAATLADGSRATTPLPGLGYAAGLFVGTLRGQPAITHGGAYKSFAAEDVRLPGLDAAILLLCNRPDLPLLPMALAVADRANPGALAPRPGPPAPAGGEAAEEPGPVPPSLLAEIAGTWRSEELDATYHITARDGRLSLAVREAGEPSPRPLDFGEFRSAGPDRLAVDDIALRLERDPGGAVAAFVLDWDRAGGLRFVRAGGLP